MSASPARAQQSFAGTWQAGATSMEVAIESWGKDCGPRPQSTRSAGGGSVQLEQNGQVVTILGADRDVRSDRCWSPNAAMRKVSSTAGNGLWMTRCKTADNDPRQEVGTYSLRALGEGKLQYQDISHFDWKLNESTCVATITTTQTLLRGPAARGAKAAKPGTPQTRAPQTQPAAPCSPGAPARLVVRPREASLELGQRLCFHARVLDAAGCPVAGVEPSWSLHHAPAIKGRLDGGCFQAGQRSAEAEGAFKVVATHAGLRAEAAVQVSAVSLPALLAKRLETGAVQGEASPDAEAAPEPPRAEATSRVAAKALPESEPRGRRWLVALSALLAALGAGLLFVRARPRARRTRSSTPSAPVSDPSLSTGSRRVALEEPLRARIRRCPTCGASYPETSAFCGSDGSALTSPE